MKSNGTVCLLVLFLVQSSVGHNYAFVNSLSRFLRSILLIICAYAGAFDCCDTHRKYQAVLSSIFNPPIGSPGAYLFSQSLNGGLLRGRGWEL